MMQEKVSLTWTEFNRKVSLHSLNKFVLMIAQVFQLPEFKFWFWWHDGLDVHSVWMFFLCTRALTLLRIGCFSAKNGYWKCMPCCIRQNSFAFDWVLGLTMLLCRGTTWWDPKAGVFLVVLAKKWATPQTHLKHIRWTGSSSKAAYFLSYFFYAVHMQYLSISYSTSAVRSCDLFIVKVFFVLQNLSCIVYYLNVIPHTSKHLAFALTIMYWTRRVVVQCKAFSSLSLTVCE